MIFKRKAQRYADKQVLLGQDFDAKAEIVKAPDGTLASKKSLLKHTGKQVAEDGSATIDNAKDAVKDLLKRDK